MALSVCINAADPVNGGAATINWLLDHGARVSVSGLYSAEQRSSLEKRVDEHIKRVAHDGKAYEKMRSRLVWSSDKSLPPTDLYKLFLSYWKKKAIGITGKHGKTTVAIWGAHLIGDAVVAGHISEKPLLSAANSRSRVAIIELHDQIPASPKIKTICIDGLSDLDAAIEVARLAGVPEKRIQSRIITLPQIPLRQEPVFQSNKLVVINDSLATEPIHGALALEKWGGPNCILIAGGTDRGLDYQDWAEKLKKCIRPTNLIFLSGSATDKMRQVLGGYARGIRAYDSLEQAWRAARSRASKYVQAVILFSPGAKSFELFDNEFERGQRFNSLVKEALK